MMNFKPIRLHVNDGYQRDLQLIRARLDPILMNKLGISDIRYEMIFICK